MDITLEEMIKVRIEDVLDDINDEIKRVANGDEDINKLFWLLSAITITNVTNEYITKIVKKEEK